MHKTKVDEGIILKRVTKREFDTEITVYTRSYGKLNLLARGTKKTQSKLAGHLEPLQLVNLMMVFGRHYDYIGSAMVKNAYFGFWADSDIYTLAGETVFFINQIIKNSLPDKRIFFLLKDFFTLLSGKDRNIEEAQALKTLFTYKLLFFLGYGFEVEHCAACKKELARTCVFDHTSGNFYHPECWENRMINNLVSKEIILLFKTTKRKSLFELSLILRENILTIKEIRKMLDSFLLFHNLV